MTGSGQLLVALERRRGTKGLTRCIGAPASQRGTHGALPEGGLRLALGLNLCSYKFGQMSMLYVLGFRPLSESQPSLVCQGAMPWTRPEGQGWRAGRSPESRCSGTPPLTRKLG